jgi:hypothetical protein
MFRLLAILAVVGAFAGALYFSGNALEAWESPKPVSQTADVKARKVRKKARAQLVSREPTKPSPHRGQKPVTWVAQLNRLCRRSEEETASIPPPITAEGTSYYLREIVPVARRFNRKADVLLAQGPNRRAAAQMHRLFASEESLLQALAVAIDDRDVDRMRRTMAALAAVGRSENKILTRLGARGCTHSNDAFALG